MIASGSLRDEGLQGDRNSSRARLLHLNRGYRLVSPSSRAPAEEGLDREVVVVLAVDAKKLDRKAGVYPALELAHDILDEEMPPGSLDRTPCREDGRLGMREEDVLETMEALRKLMRRRAEAGTAVEGRLTCPAYDDFRLKAGSGDLPRSSSARVS